MQELLFWLFCIPLMVALGAVLLFAQERRKS